LTSTNIGKWFADLKMYEKSQDQFDQITSTYEKEEASMAFYYIGFNYKRFNRKEDAYQSFKNALLHLPLRFKINAYEELAKIDEHLFKRFDQAIIYSHEALKLIEAIPELTDTKKIKLKNAFEKRLNRLLKKVK
jgi:tetratricopeptide (TPR) repeat protein